MIDKPIVFISCGQRTDAERELGSDIGQLVSELTPFAPYFAEYQTSLEGLSKHVFHALNRSVGLIAVLHHRGNVQPTNLLRASVWFALALPAVLSRILARGLAVDDGHLEWRVRVPEQRQSWSCHALERSTT